MSILGNLFGGGDTVGTVAPTAPDPAPEPVVATPEPARAPIIPAPVPQGTNRYRLVGVWEQATDINGTTYQTGGIDRISRGTVLLEPVDGVERFARCGDSVPDDERIIEATPDEAKVLGKRFVLSIVE